MKNARTAAFVAAGMLASVSIFACGSGQQVSGDRVNYVSRSDDDCRTILFSCAEGTPFFEEGCGCGCRVEQPEVGARCDE